MESVIVVVTDEDRQPAVTELLAARLEERRIPATVSDACPPSPSENGALDLEPGARARLAVLNLRELRRIECGHSDRPDSGRARIIVGLRDSADLSLVRSIYDSSVVVVWASRTPESALPGARVADYYLGPACDLGTSIDRLVALVAGDAFMTPSPAEHAMYHADAAALRSAAMRGGVGAALADAGGAIVALGTNEVPKAGGGQYWPGDPHDARDFRRGDDPATAIRTDLVEEVLSVLHARKLLSEPPERSLARQVLESLLRGSPNASGSGRRPTRAALEGLGRVVHAELAAVLDAARRGLPVAGTTLYATQYPCRACLRHLVMGGVRRVVFIPPRVEDPSPSLHDDSIAFDGASDHRVSVEPFEGVAPRAYRRLFGPRQPDPSPAGVILGEWLAIAQLAPFLDTLAPSSEAMRLQGTAAIRALERCDALLGEHERSIARRAVRGLSVS